jgi:hypothetical protein
MSLKRNTFEIQGFHNDVEVLYNGTACLLASFTGA